MGKSDKFTSLELDFIRATYPQIGPTEIARKLGRSRSAVKARIKSMGLDGQVACKPEESSKESDKQNTYARLVEARELLRLKMTDAAPAAIAAIVREYRAVLVEIERLEGGDSDTPNAFEELAASISESLRT